MFEDLVYLLLKMFKKYWYPEYIVIKVVIIKSTSEITISKFNFIANANMYDPIVKNCIAVLVFAMKVTFVKFDMFFLEE